MNHPNFSYANNTNQTAHDFSAQRPYLVPHDFNQPRQNINYPPPQPIPPPQDTTSQGTSLEDLIKTMAVTQSQIQQSQVAFQNTIQVALKSLELQVEQLAKELGEIRAQGPEKLPSQTILNSRENISSITLRSGKQVEDGHPKVEPIPPSNH